MSRIVIAGGHGTIAQHLERQLADAGHEVVGLIRNPDHQADLEANGASAVVLDLEATTVDEIAAPLNGADAVVFAAGAGPNSGAERKRTLDRDGAIKLAAASELAGATRFVLISAIGADEFDPESDDVFQVYLRAKADADRAVRSSDLDWTIIRPGSLSDDEPTGLVEAGQDVDRSSTIPRADVAALIVEVLAEPDTARVQFDVVGGQTPLAAAVASVAVR